MRGCGEFFRAVRIWWEEMKGGGRALGFPALLRFSQQQVRGVSVLGQQTRTSSTTNTPSESAAPATPALSALRERLAKGGPSLVDFVTHSSTTPEGYSVEVGTKKNPKPKPEWMKMVVPGGDKYASIKSKLRELKLNTVCEEARCPNIGECWTGGETGTATATIMILGDTCTRGCRYVLQMSVCCYFIAILT